MPRIIEITRSYSGEEGFRIKAKTRFAVDCVVPGMITITERRCVQLQKSGLARGWDPKNGPVAIAPTPAYPAPAKISPARAAPQLKPKPRDLPKPAQAQPKPAQTQAVTPAAPLGIKAFFCEPTMRRRFYLRRYRSSADQKCPAYEYGCSTVMVPLPDLDEDFAWVNDSSDYEHFPPTPKIDHADPRWPKTCERCGDGFTDADNWQVMQEQLYRRADTGELIAHRYLPPGALWFEDRQHYHAAVFPGGGPDGHVLVAMCPDGSSWCVDARASNCTMKDDDKHRCWVRHGDPRTGDVHVDKNGLTCKAGAGSIQTGRWHGFLDHGYFREKRRKS